MHIDRLMQLDREIRNQKILQSEWRALTARESMELVQEVYRLRQIIRELHAITTENIQ
jgi:hypothetical protein